jgi:hypothetical protein
VSPVKYELGFYIPEDDIFHSHRRENLKSYTVINGFSFLNSPVETGHSGPRLGPVTASGACIPSAHNQCITQFNDPTSP